MGNLDRYYDLPSERPFKADPSEPSEGVLHFPAAPPSATSTGCIAALDLVSQAAEVIKGIENHASESEKRVRSIADKAIKELQLTENRIVELETELQSAQTCIRDARVKLKESDEAAKVERSRLEAAERKMCQIEMRARTAEAQARENSNTVARIEEAIRVQILEKRLPLNKFHS